MVGRPGGDEREGQRHSVSELMQGREIETEIRMERQSK